MFQFTQGFGDFGGAGGLDTGGVGTGAVGASGVSTGGLTFNQTSNTLLPSSQTLGATGAGFTGFNTGCNVPRTLGLLGTFDGRIENELMRSDCSYVSYRDDKSLSLQQEIYNNFAQHC